MAENDSEVFAARRLYGDTKLFPFVQVGDEALPLKEYLIKPYATASIKEKGTSCEL